MSVFNQLIGDVALLSLQQDYLRCADDYWLTLPCVSLPEADLADLGRRILALPLEYRGLLYFRYCFGRSVTETEAVLSTEQAVGKLRYARELLSHSMGLHGSVVNDVTMLSSCRLALAAEVHVYDADTVTLPRYSQGFRRKLKQIHAAQSLSTTTLLFAKRAAAIFLICAVSLSTALVASAELRAKFFGWVINTFPEYSVFAPQLDGTASVSGVLELGYIPEGFTLDEQIKLRQGTILIYKDATHRQVTVSVSVSETATYALNTEDATLHPIEMGTRDAFWWDKDGEVFVVWQQDGFACIVTANLEPKQALEVAKNIKIK